jgi:hypothetical protein
VQFACKKTAKLNCRNTYYRVARVRGERVCKCDMPSSPLLRWTGLCRWSWNMLLLFLVAQVYAGCHGATVIKEKDVLAREITRADLDFCRDYQADVWSGGGRLQSLEGDVLRRCFEVLRAGGNGGVCMVLPIAREERSPHHGGNGVWDREMEDWWWNRRSMPNT